MLPGDRAAACGSPSIDAIARAVTACEPGRCGVKTGELVLSALRAAGMHCMAKPFDGLAGLAGQPVFLVSLSGGGFRASLYHAGVLRVLHEVGLLVAWRQVLVNAVSGGAIPALIWDTYLRSAAIDRLWPEQALLELVTSVPRLGGRYNWTLRTHNAWEQFLRRWWRNRTGAVCLADDISPITMVELLDYLAGGIFVFCGTHLNKPDREFFKSWFLPNMTRKDAAPFAMAKATAFPFYFRPWSFDVGKTRYQLLDAGLIDNLAAQPFMPFFVRETPMGEIHKESVWFVSHAGAEMVMPTNAAAEPWATNTKACLLLTDRILRYTVNLSQAVYELMITGFVSDYTNFDVRGVRIGTLPLPYREEPWLCTPRLPDAAAVRQIPTTLSRYALDDAVCVILQGVQAASVAMKLDADKRNSLKEELLTLR